MKVPDKRPAIFNNKIRIMEQQKQLTPFDGIKSLMNSEGAAQKFQSILGKKANGFITSVMQIVASNKDLSLCAPESIYNAAAMAAILDLPLNNNLQYAAIIPYKDNKTGIVSAQMQIMWRGFCQLAQRSGQFVTINVTDVRQGELTNRDRMTGECTFKWEQDDEVRQKLPVIGFLSYFRLLNGFEKPLYRTITELKAHGQKYSKTWNNQYGKWTTDFDAMCQKTVIKELLQKWGPLSIEMAQSIQADQSVIANIEEGRYEYPDNAHEEISEEEASAIQEQARKDQAKQAELNLADKIEKDKKKQQ